MKVYATNPRNLEEVGQRIVPACRLHYCTEVSGEFVVKLDIK